MLSQQDPIYSGQYLLTARLPRNFGLTRVPLVLLKGVHKETEPRKKGIRVLLGTPKFSRHPRGQDCMFQVGKPLA